jgi:transcriptional regulator with XRE-family HTH domain
VDEAKVFGKRLREVRIWRELTLREAAGLAGRSFSFWGQVERGERAVTNRNTLEAMAGAFPASRQSVYWADLGRGLVTERRTRDQGVQALIHAEQLAPQDIRNNPFVRETVADLLRQARRDAGGRELRGLAWRMGVATIG